MKRLVFLLFLLCTIALAHTFHGAAIAPNTLKGWIVTSDTGFIFYTPDCGLTWINQSFFTSRYFYDIFFFDEQKGWIGTNQGFIYYTQNGGTNWVSQAMGLSYFIYKIFFIDDSCGWAACYRPIIAQTINGGNLWQQIILPCPPFVYDSIDIRSISFVDRQKGWICAGQYIRDDFPYDTCFGGQGYIAKSSDGGLNWQLLLRDTIYDFFDIKMLDTLNGFVVGGNDRPMSAVVMRTFDGGNTWQNVTIPAQAKYLRSLKFVGNHAWAVGHNGTIIHSSNGGNTWSMQTSNVNATLYDVDFSDTLHGLVAGDSYVLYTHDGGNTWHIANLGIEEESWITPPSVHSSFSIYPNPARSFFVVRIPSSINSQMLKIFDVSGKLVKEIDSPSAHNGQVADKRVSLKGIKPGVYFVQVGNALVKAKLVVTR